VSKVEYQRQWRARNPEYTRKWYADNREKCCEATRKHRKKSHEKLASVLWVLKSERPCFDCGGMFSPEAMDFDHVRGEKLFNVGDVFNHPWDEVRREMDKCDLVCACCHRLRTQVRRDKKKQTKNTQQ